MAFYYNLLSFEETTYLQWIAILRNSETSCGHINDLHFFTLKMIGREIFMELPARSLLEFAKAVKIVHSAWISKLHKL